MDEAHPTGTRSCSLRSFVGFTKGPSPNGTPASIGLQPCPGLSSGSTEAVTEQGERGGCRDHPLRIFGDHKSDANLMLGRASLCLDSVLPARKIRPSRMAATTALYHQSPPGPVGKFPGSELERMEWLSGGPEDEKSSSADEFDPSYYRDIWRGDSIHGKLHRTMRG